MRDRQACSIFDRFGQTARAAAGQFADGGSGHDRSAPADFLERAEVVYGDREAVVAEPNPPGGGVDRFTYAQFAEMARSLGAALDDLGVGESERVATVSPNAARILLSMFGVSVFGRILVPVNFRLNAEEIRSILEHSCCSVLLVDSELERPDGPGGSGLGALRRTQEGCSPASGMSQSLLNLRCE